MVVDKLIQVVSPFVNGKVYRQGSFTEKDTYPSLFITFWENESSDGNHYNNQEVNGYKYDFDLNVYGNNTNQVYETMEKVILALKNNDFIVEGQGFDIGSDEPNYIGRHVQVYYIDYTKEV